MIPLLFVITIMLLSMHPGMAETQTAQASPYRIVLVASGGWANNNEAVVKVTVTDKNSIGWQKIEYRMNRNAWIDCEDQFDGNRAEITVRENGTFTLRVTDPQGQTYEETATIISIDLYASSVNAVIDGTNLRVKAKDDLSGIAGVQVNSMLFTTMTGDVLDIELDQNMNRFEKLAIRAFDYAGNFSDPITLDNPNYVEPVDSTPVPTATAKPTKKPASSASPTDASATGTPTTAPTATPVKATERHNHGLGSSLIYVSDDEWPVITAAPTAIPTPAPTPEPIIQTEYITIGPGMPYQADGNSHTLDVLYSAATNKQFITLQSKSGNTFYLVIDYDKPIDEEAEMYETHFLNLVDERDLLALMSDEEKEEVPTPTPQVIYVTPVPTGVPVPTAVPEEPDKKPDQMTAILALVAILALIGVGAFILLKKNSKPAISKMDNDFDLDDDDEADETEDETSK